MLEDILKAYDWFDHPDGPKFVETHRDEYRTAGHWLFLPGAVSWFHQVFNNAELWLIHEGKLILHTIDRDGKHHSHVLGTDIGAGEQPVFSVPTGCLQAAEIPEGIPYAFGTNICAPAFSYDQLQINKYEDLIREYPQHKTLFYKFAADKPTTP